MSKSSTASAHASVNLSAHQEDKTGTKKRVQSENFSQTFANNSSDSNSFNNSISAKKHTFSFLLKDPQQIQLQQVHETNKKKQTMILSQLPISVIQLIISFVPLRIRFINKSWKRLIKKSGVPSKYFLRDCWFVQIDEKLNLKWLQFNSKSNSASSGTSTTQGSSLSLSNSQNRLPSSPSSPQPQFNNANGLKRTDNSPPKNGGKLHLHLPSNSIVSASLRDSTSLDFDLETDPDTVSLVVTPITEGSLIATNPSNSTTAVNNINTNTNADENTITTTENLVAEQSTMTTTHSRSNTTVSNTTTTSQKSPTEEQSDQQPLWTNTEETIVASRKSLKSSAVHPVLRKMMNQQKPASEYFTMSSKDMDVASILHSMQQSSKKSHSIFNKKKKGISIIKFLFGYRNHSRDSIFLVFPNIQVETTNKDDLFLFWFPFCKHLNQLEISYKRTLTSSDLSLLNKTVGDAKCVIERLQVPFSASESFVQFCEKGLSHNSSIQILDLQFQNRMILNSVQASTVSTSLQHLPLRELYLKRCSLGHEAITQLLQRLSNSATLSRLNLENNNIGGLTCQSIANFLEANHSLQVLNLNYNPIGNDGCEYLAAAMSKNDSLVELNLGFSDAEDSGFAIFMESLKHNQSLCTLKVQSNPISRRTIKILGGVLESNSILRKLHIDFAGLQKLDAVPFVEALGNNTGLVELYVSFNNLCYMSCEMLKHSLKKNNRLERLSIHGSIEDQSLQNILDGIQQNTSLEELDLSHNQLGNHSFTALGKCFEKNKSMTKFKLNKSTNAHLPHHACVAKALESIKFNTQLHTLILEKNNIDDVGAKALGSALRINRSIVYLDIHANEIFDEGCIAIFKALKVNSSVKVLKLDECNGGNSSIIALAKSLRKNSNCALEQFSFDRNRVSGPGCTALCDAISASPHVRLRTLSLNYNHITDKGITVLGKCLLVNRTIQECSVIYNRFSSSTVFAEALSVSTSLIKLNLMGCCDNKSKQKLWKAVQKNPFYKKHQISIDVFETDENELSKAL